MSQPAKVQEPSMEEILASIRRIIADDEAKPADVAVTAGVGGNGPVAYSEASRLHNVAPVASHAAPTVQGQGERHSMLGGLEKAKASPSHDEADVFDLTDEMALPETAPGFRKVDPKDDLEFADAPPSVAERREASQQQARPSGKATPDMADILSNATASAVESAFNSLATTVLSANSRTLEDLVKEMMRPMLKSWLDDNLPSLVERIVRSEIERVARGR